MTENIDKLFQRTKGKLFFNQSCSGLLGTLLCKLEFKWTTEIPTAAINPKILLWNPDFFLKLDEETRVTVLAHELNHNARMHGIRRGNRDPETWNRAGDYVINVDLLDQGFYMGGFPYVLDQKYRGWSTEDVYDDLMKKQDPKSKPKPNPLGQDIMPADEMTAAEKIEAISDVIGAITVAKQSGQPGSIPNEVETYLDEFLNPILPWNTLLYNFFNEMTNQEYSYARPNRRYEDPLMRGLSGANELEHLIYYLDISGSTSDEQVTRFNSEVKFIWDELAPKKLTLVTFDTQIQDIFVYEEGDEFEKLKVHGRGGTDLRDVYRHMQQEAPTAAIIFTDLYVHIPDDPKIPIFWAVSGNPNASVPYGKLVLIPDKI